VGLYRDIYGIVPKWDRLHLEPHLTPELAGTQVKYWLRGRTYVIDLRPDDYGVTVDGFTVRETKPFGVDVVDNALLYFSGERRAASMSVARPAGARVEIRIEAWPAEGDGPRRWAESCGQAGVTLQHVFSGLAPNMEFQLSSNGRPGVSLVSDGDGKAAFDEPGGGAAPVKFEMRRAGPAR